MSFTWSKYQQEIFNYALDPDKGSFCIEAVAGSGKTTVLIEIAKRLAAANPDERILFVSFNKSIAEKLAEETKEYPNMICKTSHSFGLSVLYRSNMKFHVDDRKWVHYIEDYYKAYIECHNNRQFRKRVYIDNCLRLFYLCRANMMTPDEKSIEKLADKSGIVRVYNEVKAVSLMIEKSYSLFNFRIKNKFHQTEYIIDYSDMINLPISESFRKFIPKYKYVLCDEAQDLNTAQQSLIISALKKDGKIIPIGDGKQSIYYFSTGRANPFDEFKKICNNVCLPLSVSYRCGKNIINEAKKINPQIEAYECAEDGEVIHQTHLDDIKGGDMVLCRTNLPLIILCMKLIAANRYAYVKGKEIGGELKVLVERVCKDDNGLGGKTALLNNLDDYLDSVREMLLKSGVTDLSTHPGYIKILEEVEIIKAISENCETVTDIRMTIGLIFNEISGKNTITLSSIHRAKGLEADNVYIICPELLCSNISHNPIEIAQERNLKYVAVTRPKKKLVFVDVEFKDLDDIEIIPYIKKPKDTSVSEEVSTTSSNLVINESEIETEIDNSSEEIQEDNTITIDYDDFDF